MKISMIILPVLFCSMLQAALAQETNIAAPIAGGLQLNSQTDEERIQFLMEVAQVYFKEKNYESAVNAYERILEINPEQKEARYIIAHVYIDAKQYAKAEELLIELVNAAPEDFKLKNNLAWLYATAEDPKIRSGAKAVKIAQEAMVLAPNDHHVWSTLSEAHYINGEYEKAFRAIKQMAALAARYGQDLTKESVDDYNDQIRKCKRAWDTQKMLAGEDEE